MNNALLAGVSGLSSHQTMLDVAGNNLANVNTSAFKASRVTFAELLSQTVRSASQPSETTGGTNPMQIGSGVRVASVDRDMTQGSLINTGQALDMAVEGAGYFVLNDGEKDVYTRVGSFAVDSDYYLVDPATGNRVQRTGSEGTEEGFQTVSSNDIRIPYDMALPAKDTETITYIGNLSADESNLTQNQLSSGMQYTVGGASAAASNRLDQLDQGSTLVDGDIISISGTQRDGTAVAATDFAVFAGGVSKTVDDLLTAIEALFPGCTASVSNGKINLIDDDDGYSQTDLQLEMKAG
jgi:flagellar hook protein FlgE